MGFRRGAFFGCLPLCALWPLWFNFCGGGGGGGCWGFGEGFSGVNGWFSGVNGWFYSVNGRFLGLDLVFGWFGN